MANDAQRILALEAARETLLLTDAEAVGRLLRSARRRHREKKPIDRSLAKAEAMVGDSRKAIERRAMACPTVTYPDELPVSQRREEIIAMIDKHPVVILCGDTGSGKTTQLPKMCLELGRGVRGRIGCTQPRRIAATSVARRVAEELSTKVGRAVGYQVRFDDRTGAETLVKFMTDGILLAETRGDPELWQYDTLIIDEAHERSLNIDFLLGYLHELLPRRPDLKVIISSATLDAESFSEFFGGAPIVTVEGRTFPVHDEWLPPLNDDEELSRHVARAAEWITRQDKEGDMLVFLPGEREIRNAADKIRGYKWPKTEVLPLYARLDLAQQQKVFQVGGRRRIILATNVAETSLTIPGIRYVIDSGVARITRFNPRTQVQSLQIRPVSQASVRQRRGRCGRMQNGICVHLYDEEDLERRIGFTPPEIRRTSLAGVILRMKSLNLPPITEFPFVDPPQKALVREGIRTLFEIGALDADENLTPLGRDLARFPLDPRLARMIVAGQERGVRAEVMIIAAGLSVQDPRDRPHEKAEEADAAHRRWRHEGSDFIGLLRLWNDLQKLSGRKSLKTFCRNNFVSLRRVLEWQNILRELGDLGRDFGWEGDGKKRGKGTGKKIDALAVHKALLTGMPSLIGWQEEAVAYRGSHERRFHLFPGSVLHAAPPEWVMAFSLVETTRLYARQAAVLDPEWMEEVAPHLCKKTYHDPVWNEKAGRVEATERISACGLGLHERKGVPYGVTHPENARGVFLREALVRGRVRDRGRRGGRGRGRPTDSRASNSKATDGGLPRMQDGEGGAAPKGGAVDSRRGRPGWLVHLLQVRRDVKAMEQKLRRPSGLLDEEAMEAFFAERVPEHVNDLSAFDRWRREAEKANPDLLKIPLPSACVAHANSAAWQPGAFPDSWRGLRLRYLCAPDEIADGVTLEIPLAALGGLPTWTGEWLVPGMLPDKVTGLLRSLPKNVRHELQPISSAVAGFLAARPVEKHEGPVLPAMCSYLREAHGLDVTPADFDSERLPGFLKMNFRVVADRKTIAAGRNLRALQVALESDVGERFQAESSSAFDATGQTSWTFGEIPVSAFVGKGLVGYPALVDEGKTVGLTAFPTKADANLNHRLGLARLFRLEAPDVVGYLEKRLPFPPLVAAQLATLGEDPGRNRADLTARLILNVLGDPRSAEEWNLQQLKTRGHLHEQAGEFGKVLKDITDQYDVVSAKLEALRSRSAYDESVADLDRQIHGLFFTRFLLLAENLVEYPRYFRAMDLRLDRLARDPRKDMEKLKRVEPFRIRAEVSPGQPFAALVEEFRIAVFAPVVGVKEKVSAKRLESVWAGEPAATRSAFTETDKAKLEKEASKPTPSAEPPVDVGSLADSLSRAWGSK